ALLPHDLVGERFTGQEEDLSMAGKVRDCKTDVRQKGAGEQIDLLASNQLLGGPYCVARVGVVVADHEFELATVDAAGGIDLLDRQLHTHAVGAQKGRLCLVTVQFTYAYGALRLHAEGDDGGTAEKRKRAQQAWKDRHGCPQVLDLKAFGEFFGS